MPMMKHHTPTAICGCLLALAVSASSASAETRYFTTKSLLKEFFPKSDKVTYERFEPSRDQRKALGKRLGYDLAKPSYVFFVARTGDNIDGYAFIDDEMGRYQPITFGVKISKRGAVLRQEILVYRSSRGGAVRESSFREQFTGKTVRDPVTANVDIDTVTGATISSHAMAKGVRRALVLFDEVFCKSRGH